MYSPAVRHRERYPYRRHARRHARWPYLLILIAAIAALAAGLTLGVRPAPAGAAATAPLSLTQDRGAESPVTEDSPAMVQAQLNTLRATLAASRARAAAAALAARTYTVRPGDSLSAVAARHCTAARDWTGIYAASRARGWTARNASALTAGQHLFLSCAYLPSMLRYAPLPPPVVHLVRTVRAATSGTGHRHYQCGDGDGDGMDMPCSALHRTYHRAATASSTYHRTYQAPAASTYHAASGSYQACVISRESGGQSQVMNSSGHYGLYQFDYGTWVSGGGSGGSFGHASVSEQNRVFASVYAARGTQPWSPSDGC